MAASDGLTPEHIDIHRFAGRVLGCSLPRLHRFFSPIVQATERTDRILKRHFEKQRKDEVHLSPLRSRKDSRRGTKQATKDVEAARRRSRKSSIIESGKSSRPSIVPSSLTPVPTTIEWKTGMTEGTKTVETLTSKKPRPQLVISPEFQPPKGEKVGSKVHTLSSVTILSPVFKKGKHCKAKSDGAAL